ncbi:hypothetical protein ACFQMA_14465 [Halosimplex aquaticum]|uniref:Amphi-Trp domain-containing protein n=1 Tax=Halosimplex aquaticum TaxID=3026162 RepID=A0ABD5Y6T6_9EURY|nr:hypothetical protein [Halosimplex aquaticum]
MDRISALRNVEDALGEFEDGEIDLAELEREVRGTLRTYATEFDGELAAYRARSAESDGDGEAGDADQDGTPQQVDGTVVLAGSPQGARERVRELVDRPGEFTVERFDEP